MYRKEKSFEFNFIKMNANSTCFTVLWCMSQKSDGGAAFLKIFSRLAKVKNWILILEKV